MKKRFVDAGEPLKEITETRISEYLDKEKHHSRLYIPATVQSNPYIQQDYVFELEQKPESLRKALLDGNWNVF